MINLIVVLIVLIVGLGASLWMAKEQIDEDADLIIDLLDDCQQAEKKAAQHERTITLLMQRELSGTWLPNVEADDLALTS